MILDPFSLVMPPPHYNETDTTSLTVLHIYGWANCTHYAVSGDNILLLLSKNVMFLTTTKKLQNKKKKISDTKHMRDIRQQPE